MEEIDLKELLTFLKDKIKLFIIITVGVALIGCVYGLFIQTPLYSSYTTVILASENQIDQNAININKNLVDTYAEIAKSRRVLDKVIEELELDLSYEQLSNKISVTSVNDTEIIKIKTNDPNAILAKNIANSTAEYFTEEIVELMGLNNVDILDEAIESQEPYNINVIKQTIIYVIIGAVLAVAILFTIFYFDRTIKSVEQVENKIKLPILGSVKVYNKVSKGGKK